MTSTAGPAARIPASAALLLMPLALLSSLVGGWLSYELGLDWRGAVLLVELFAMALPAVWVAWQVGPPGPVLGLDRASGRRWIGAVLIGVAFWYVNLLVIAPIGIEWGDGIDSELEKALTSDDPLVLRLFIIAIVPAVCEELLVRGAVCRGLAGRFGGAAAIVGSALFFSLLHLSPARALPTLALGLVLGWVVLAGGSLWLAIVIHAINNGIAILLSEPTLEPVVSILATYPAFALPAAVALTLAGLILIRNRSPQPL